MMMTVDVRIVRIWDETPEIRCFELRAEGGAQLPLAMPGAHIDVHLHGKMIRQYSLWNGPGDKNCYLIGVKREGASRGGSTAMHALLEGQQVTISEPKNNFPLADGEGPHLLLAGGIGITPLLSMARTLTAGNVSHHLHFFTRGKEYMPFGELLANQKDVTFHYGLVPPVLDDVIEKALSTRRETAHVYVCGPAPSWISSCMSRNALVGQSFLSIKNIFRSTRPPCQV